MLVMATKRTTKRQMSDDHKAALARGRVEGRAVRDYLEALRASKPKRGRKRTAASIEKRLAVIDEQLKSADGLTELRLVQERLDLGEELQSVGDGADLAALEEAFVEVARSYSDRQGISYAAWRTVGVAPAVLKRAGVTRSQ